MITLNDLIREIKRQKRAIKKGKRDDFEFLGFVEGNDDIDDNVKVLFEKKINNIIFYNWVSGTEKMKGFIDKVSDWTNMTKFRKLEIKKYNWIIDYIRQEVFSGRDFWASLFSAGLTFVSDIERFCKYALQVRALDISEEIIKRSINNQQQYISMKIETLKEKLDSLLAYEKIENWESLTQKEQGYSYELGNNFGEVKNSLLRTIEAIEKMSENKDEWLNEFNKDREEIKAVRGSYIANLKKAVGLMAKILSQI